MEQTKKTVLVHRGLDDAAANDNLFVDVNFRQTIDFAVTSSVRLFAEGNGDWHVHGWVGPAEALAGLRGGGGAAAADAAERREERARQSVLRGLRGAEEEVGACAVM